MEIIWCDLHNGFKQHTNAAAAINGALTFKSACDIGTILGIILKEHNECHTSNKHLVLATIHTR